MKPTTPTRVLKRREVIAEELDSRLIDLVVVGLPKDCAMVASVIISPVREKELAEDRSQQYQDAKNAIVQYCLDLEDAAYQKYIRIGIELGRRDIKALGKAARGKRAPRQ